MQNKKKDKYSPFMHDKMKYADYQVLGIAIFKNWFANLSIKIKNIFRRKHE